LATLHLKNAILYMGTTTAAVVTEATEVHFSIDADRVDDSAFGDTWETRLKGPLKYTGSFSGNFDTASSDLFDIAVSATICKLYAYPDRAAMTQYYYGTVWPNLTIDMVRTDKGNISGDFEGSGQLAKN